MTSCSGGYTRYRVNTEIDRWLGDMAGPLGWGVGRLATLWPHTARGFGIARLLRGDGRARYEALLADEWLLGKSTLNAAPGFDFRSVWDSSAEGLVNQMCNADIRLYVPEDLMVKVDRVSMAVGLEVRAPFLDRDLFEFVARAPQAVRKNGRVDKSALRRGLATDLGAAVRDAWEAGFSGAVRRLVPRPAARSRLRHVLVFGRIPPAVLPEALVELAARGSRERQPRSEPLDLAAPGIGELA